MQSTLAKSVFVGLAALSFASVAQLNANAASSAKTTSNVTLTTDATTRNVVPTGSNAIYSYPKTVKKSARTVASKATVAKLAASKSSKDYFRAYRVLTTSRGSVYYKVVSFDGAVRGYIYGGKSTSAFAGGLKAATTTEQVTLSATDKASAYYFANAGTKNVTWNNPRYTQYKAKKMVTNTTPFKYDILTVTDAKKKSREGSVYYYVKDATNPSVSGWVYAKALTKTAPAAANSVTVNYKDASGKLIKTANVAPTDKSVAVNADVTTDVAAQLTKNSATYLEGTGYTFSATDLVNKTALTGIKAGSTINLVVAKNANATSKVSFKIAGDGVKPATALPASLLEAKAYPKLTDAQQAAFAGTEGTVVSMPTLESSLLVSGKPLYQLVGTSTTTNGVKTTNVYTYNKALTEAQNAKVNYGSTITLYYTHTTTTSAASTTPAPDAGNNNYAE
ncbi:hypothetical protein ACFP3T_03125 [Lactiplantibacillus dongliensis]|uniref:S-layer protein n=1 Tax=Lactiplantibacillus dongliensis TaxID=2559919 RepID=A0ABW1R1K8_9LACO|nr:hypothetical protein [Lactiplantibacillus dongliensis]